MLSYDAFYGGLGVTAEEVGVTSLGVVARAAPGLFAILGVMAVLGVVQTR